MEDPVPDCNFMIGLVESLPPEKRGEFFKEIWLKDVFHYFLYSKRLKYHILSHRLPKDSVKISILFDSEQCVLLAQGPKTYFFLRFAHLKKKEITENEWKIRFIHTVLCMTSPIKDTDGYHVRVKEGMLEEDFLEFLGMFKVIFNTQNVSLEYKFPSIGKRSDRNAFGSMEASRMNVLMMLDYFLKKPPTQFRRHNNPVFVRFVEHSKYCFYTNFLATGTEIRRFLYNYIKIGSSINKVIGLGVSTKNAEIRTLSYILEVFPDAILSAEWKEDMFMRTYKRKDGVTVKFGHLDIPVDKDGKPLSDQAFFYVFVGHVENLNDMVDSLVKKKLREVWAESSNKFM